MGSQPILPPVSLSLSLAPSLHCRIPKNSAHQQTPSRTCCLEEAGAAFKAAVAVAMLVAATMGVAVLQRQLANPPLRE